MTTTPVQFGFYFAGDHGGTIPAVTPFDELPLRIQLHHEHKDGLRPTKACAERWLWFRDSRIAELEALMQRDGDEVFPAFGDKVAGFDLSLRASTRYVPAVTKSTIAAILADIREHHAADCEQYSQQYRDAFQWERQRYGNVYATVEIARIQV